MAENTAPGPKPRLVTSNGQREPNWQLTLEQNPLYAHWVTQLQAIWKQRQRPAPPPRSPAPDRCLRLVVSQAQLPDALDREWESAEQAYPQCRHWVVQIKHAIRERGLGPVLKDSPWPRPSTSATD
jgi:hypothetical protein